MSKPVLLFDGDCYFCKRWIERWREFTGDKIEYQAYQDVLLKFPQVSESDCQKSIQLLTPEGKHYRAAEAVFRTFALGGHQKWLLWAYLKIPGVAAITEACYRIAASNRIFFSNAAQLLYGTDLTPSKYEVTRWIFLRGLALIYFAAFASLAVQIAGLIGNEGIAPAGDFLRFVHQKLGAGAYWRVPSLAWLSPTNILYVGLCAAGAVLALCLFLGFSPAPLLSLVWIFYLSIVSVGGPFLSFQWDNLLLEAGFLAIFLAPFHIFPESMTRSKPSGAVRFLFQCLLFRLMFSSGMVKLASGDYSWKNLSALVYHYETQPLPTFLSWYVHQAPEIFHRITAGLVFFVEIAVPFFIFAPRRIRYAAAWTLIAFQAAVMLTGNYTFFNLLTILLCMLLFDDRCWPGWIRRFANLGTDMAKKKRMPAQWPRPVIVIVTCFILTLSFPPLLSVSRYRGEWPDWIKTLVRATQPFHIVNGYGLFAVMTKERSEIIIEGSSDRIHWKAYEFHYKPQRPDKAPQFVAPHQPRLDWQMWFAALGNYQQNPWFIVLCRRLMDNSPAVLRLLKTNPFPDEPPLYIRAMYYRYRFTDPETRRKTGAWWDRQGKGMYMPVVSRGMRY
ncbi:MAG: hypothetical protein A2Z83_00630 [Omnitrophica bacterium GWA2_52_8]|nr:MAG: hypothetical protein A2Z83_00630 [Omnitrophica bacterium GWA2_52_8]